MFNYCRLALKSLLLFGLLPAILGWMAVDIGLAWRDRTAEFIDNALQTEGKIDSIESSGSDAIAQVRYYDSAGKEYRKSVQLDSAQVAAARVAGFVSLIYDARVPESAVVGHVVAISYKMIAAWCVIAIGVGAMAFGLLRIFRTGLQLRRISRMFASGQIVDTTVREHGIAPGGAMGRFTYAFRGPDGRWYEGKSPEFCAEKLAEWPVGLAMKAVYDPQNPRRTEPDVFGILAANGRGRQAAGN